MGNSWQKLSSCNIRRKDKEDEIYTFTCEICMEIKGPCQRFKNKSCSHPFCLDCMSKYIDTKVHDHTSNVFCPHLACNHDLDPLWCRPIVSGRTFDRWCDLLCEAMIDGQRKAYCPYKDCLEVVVNECGGNVKKTMCPNCKKWFCFQCKVPWHSGYRCDDETGLMRDRNDILFGKLVEKKQWQKCPQCNQCVELVSGCAIITCRCKTFFCYLCGSRFTLFHPFTCKGIRFWCL